ncbi:MAG: hypothetical protein IJT97_09835 [Bacteroidaceae bacterium]|nr:hypothetical protein [Bacteroidaceae bacterium]
MSTVALNNLWDYLQSLALSNSNKDWLANKLIESKVEDIDEEARREETLYSMFGAWADDPNFPFMEEAIRNGRISGITRHIVAFDEA